MSSILHIQQWAKETIEQGPQIKYDIEPSKMDDYELATAIMFHIDQIKQCERNLQTLDIWPENRSEFYNEELLATDGQYHAECLEALRAEWQRRVIP